MRHTGVMAMNDKRDNPLNGESAPRPTAEGRRPMGRRGGFTLMEVLVAMGIFLVGVICVAALFPAAVSVQRDTVESLMGQQIARRALEQMRTIAAAGVEDTDPLTYHHDADPDSREGTLAEYTKLTNADDPIALNPGRNKRVMPLIDYSPIAGLPDIFAPTAGLNGGSAPEAPETGYPSDGSERGFRALFGWETTSYPSYGDLNYRDYYWFPFIQISEVDADGGVADLPSVTWQAFVIVMRRQPNMMVPQVRYVDVEEDLSRFGRIKFDDTSFDNDEDDDGLPDLIKPGDFVLADNGERHRVILADADGCTVDAETLSVGNLTLQRLYFVVDVQDTDGDGAPDAITREGPSPVAWIEGPVDLPVEDLGP